MEKTQEMKKIYILLTRSTTILSRMVHLFTAAPYTHVSISFDESLQPLYSSSRKNGETLFPAGPCIELFHRGYLKKHQDIPCALYELEVSDEVYCAAKMEVERIMKQADKYNFNIIGLILCQFHIPYHRKSHYFCSQFVGEILCRSKALKLPKDTSLMHPIDYMNMPELSCKFDGVLYELISLKQIAG